MPPTATCHRPPAPVTEIVNWLSSFPASWVHDADTSISGKHELPSSVLLLTPQTSRDVPHQVDGKTREHRCRSAFARWCIIAPLSCGRTMCHLLRRWTMDCFAPSNTSVLVALAVLNRWVHDASFITDSCFQPALKAGNGGRARSRDCMISIERVLDN